MLYIFHIMKEAYSIEEFQVNNALKTIVLTNHDYYWMSYNDYVCWYNIRK